MENIVEVETKPQRENVQKSKSMKEDLLSQPISVMMAQNLWVRQFIHECCLLFGMPCVSGECMSKTDRFKYAFGLMNVSTGMRRFSHIWIPMHEKIDPKDAAWEFCRRFHEITGKMLVPDSSEEIEMATKLIPKLINKKSVQQKDSE